MTANVTNQQTANQSAHFLRRGNQNARLDIVDIVIRQETGQNMNGVLQNMLNDK